MLYIILTVFLILPVLAGVGDFFQRFFGRVWEGISSDIIVGLMILGLVWNVISFFYPLDFVVEVISMVLGFSLFILQRTYRKFVNFRKKQIFLLLSALLICTFFGSFYPFILDHFGYYVPSINWLREFGLVKGIANLDWVLGQISPWHILQAGFSHFSDVSLRFNVIFLFTFFIYITEKKAYSLWVISPLFFLFIQSPSPDLPAIGLSIIIFHQILRKNKNYPWVFTLSIFACTIKPTIIWLPLLCFLCIIKDNIRNIKHIVFGGVLFSLYIFKNIWLSGYPLFPVLFIPSGVEWQPAEYLLKKSSEIAILKTFDMQYSLNEIQQFSTFEYIYRWLFLSGIKGIINSSFLISIIILGIYSFRKRRFFYILIFICILIKSIFIFIFSAQYRFFIDVFLVVFILLFENLSFEKSRNIFLVFAFMIASILSYPHIITTTIPSFHLGHIIPGFYKKQLLIPSYYAENQYNIYILGNLKFYSPNYIFNYTTPLPSITLENLKKYHVNGFFPQYTEKKDGFISKKLSEKESKELENIIQSQENFFRDKKTNKSFK